MTSKVFGHGDNCFNHDVLYNMMLLMPLQDLASFSRTCRSIHELAKPVQKLRRFETLDLASISLIQRLSEAVEQSPDVLNRVKLVYYSQYTASSLYFRWTYWATSGGSRFLVNHTQNLPLVNKETRRRWCEDAGMLGFARVSTLVSLLTACPALETFEYRGSIDDLYRNVRETFQHQGQVEDLQPSAFTSAWSMLSLRTIKLFGNIRLNTVTVERLLCIASTPKLHTLHLSGMTILTGQSDELVGISELYSVPNVRRLVLESCHIAPKTVAAFIENLPNLELCRAFAVNQFWCFISRAYFGDRLSPDLRPGLQECCFNVEGAEFVDPETSYYLGELCRASHSTLEDRKMVISCTEISTNTWVFEILSRQLSMSRAQIGYSIQPKEVLEVGVRAFDINLIDRARHRNSSGETGMLQKCSSWLKRSLIEFKTKRQRQ